MLRAIPTRDVGLFGGATRASAVQVLARVDDLDEPRAGDRITLADGTTYRVRTGDREGSGGFWRLTLGEA